MAYPTVSIGGKANGREHGRIGAFDSSRCLERGRAAIWFMGERLP